MTSIISGFLAPILVMGAAAVEQPKPRVPLAAIGREIRAWSVDEGLPSTRVDAIAQTADRYLWTGSSNGVARFNGRQFKVFDTTKIPALNHNNIPRLCSHPDGSLWLATVTGNVAFHEADGNGKFNAVPGAAEMLERNPWVWTADGFGVLSGVRHGNTVRIHYITRGGVTEVASWKGGKPRSLAVSTDGRRWCVCPGRGLVEIISGKPERIEIDGLPLQKMSLISSGQDGVLWAACPGAIVQYFDGAWKIRQRLLPQGDHFDFNHAAIDQEGYLWLYSSKAGCRVWTGDDDLVHLQSGRNSIWEPVLTLLPSNGSGVWLGTFNGLQHVRFSPFVTWSPPRSARYARGVSVSEGGDGGVWLGCYGSVSRLEHGGVGFDLATEIPAGWIPLVVGGAGSTGWVSNQTGAMLLGEGRDFETPNLPLPEPSDQVSRTGFVIDKEGCAWLSSYEGLFRARDPSGDGGFERVEVPGLPPDVGFQCPIRGPDDQLFVVARRVGIFSFDGTTWQRMTPPEDALAGFSQSITFDSNGWLWGSTGKRGEIACWKDGAGFHAKLADLGFGEGRVGALAADHVGGLWLATLAHGVVQVDGGSLQRALAGGPVATFTRFNRAHGVGSLDGPYSPAGLICASDGKIWEANGAGVSVIDPERWTARRDAAEPPPVHLENIEVDGRPGDLNSGTLSVPPGGRRLEIGFVALDFGALGETRYRYRLLGYDDQWSEPSSHDSTIYRHLPPGGYTFEVTATNHFGTRPGRAASLAIEVAPLWWQRSSVWILTSVGLLGCIGFLNWKRTQRYHRRQFEQEAFSRQLIESQEDERKRIAGELHDSLGQHLLLIKHSTELARRKLEIDSIVHERLGDVSQIAADALRDVRHITSDLRPAELDHLGLRVAIQSMLERVTEHTNLAVTHNLSQLPDSWDDPTRIAIYRLVQEGANNAIKHSNATELDVLVSCTKRLVTITIRDNGDGFRRDRVPGARRSGPGMGLSGMSERVKLLGGTMGIESHPGSGTQINLLVPNRSLNSRRRISAE